MKCCFLWAAVLTAACHRPSQCQSALDEAQALAGEGRVTEAAALLAEAAGSASKPEHRDKLLFQQGLVLARAGLGEEALGVWDPLYKTTGDENIAGRIVYEKGMLARSQGELGEAERWFMCMVTDHPEHGLALMGLLRLEKLVRERAGDDAIRTLLESLLGDALKTSFGDDVLWELSAWHRDHGEDEEAKAYLLAIRFSYPFPTGGRASDALFELATLAEKQKKWKEAIGYLEEVAGPIGKSPFIGSSSGGEKARALMRMGRIYEDHLGDPETALKLYMEVAGMPDLETMNDDALLEAARVLVGMGRNEKACKILGRLLRDFPYSNKRKKAKKMLVQASCPGVDDGRGSL
jgi:tetratricopeptide (TPR) repeat protein